MQNTQFTWFWSICWSRSWESFCPKDDLHLKINLRCKISNIRNLIFKSTCTCIHIYSSTNDNKLNVMYAVLHKIACKKVNIDERKITGRIFVLNDNWVYNKCVTLITHACQGPRRSTRVYNGFLWDFCHQRRFVWGMCFSNLCRGYM